MTRADSSYLLSALGITAIGGTEAKPPARVGRRRSGDLLEGWCYLLRHHTLRPLFLNVMAVNALIMAVEPLLTFMMLGRLGFSAWEYGLAFAVPCVGGLVGSWLARRVVARYSQRTVLLTLGVVRACWPPGLAFIRPGVPGLLIVMTTELGLIICMSIAALTGLWGVLATLTGPRIAIAAAGVLLLGTPLLLPRRTRPAVGTGDAVIAGRPRAFT